MSNRLSMAGVMSSAVVVTMLAMAACSGSKVTDPSAGDEGGASSEAGGTSSTDTTATGGAVAQGGSTSTGTVTAGGATPFECQKGVPDGPVLAPGTNGTWGTSGSISGGTFAYQQDDPADKITPDASSLAGSITLKATLAANHYTGYGLYFKDPKKCWNLSQYTGGVKMALSGTLGGGKLVFQIQQNSNYPIDTANAKGACVGDWKDGSCANFESDAIEVVEAGSEISIPWTQFMKGAPVTTIDTTQILGVQWQINCPTDATASCTPALTIGKVELY